MAEIIVSARNVAKEYPIAGGGQVSVLQSVTCAVASGDTIALVGPSGSGKSTLMHILGGLVAPTGGTIGWPALGRREGLQPAKVQFVFQSPSLFPALTVRRNVALPMVLAGGITDAQARADAMLERFQLSELATKLPEELSGGQAQRVSMARALAVAPRLILADEPTGQLDSATASDFLDLVLQLARESGCALVIATHDPDIAKRMQQVWSIDHGILKIPHNNPEPIK